ncbi:MAG: transcriptional regulator [Nitrosopumilus sp.]|jgi:predicted transcriptional regulator|nr:transcriptional regulator [Nitrosopumilus sp.]MDH3619219.1 transcriptional regulator [Nitrosopumilus sp.]
MRQVRRSNLQIYYDILKAINHESKLGKVKPTRVQNLCHMSYDKFSKYLLDLERKNMIHNSDIKITPKGNRFLRDYGKINNLIEKFQLKYVVGDDQNT